MYKFYKIFLNGNKKCVLTFNSTLDPEYHGYINWCNENNMKWEVIETSTGNVKFKSK